MFFETVSTTRTKQSEQTEFTNCEEEISPRTQQNSPNLAPKNSKELGGRLKFLRNGVARWEEETWHEPIKTRISSFRTCHGDKMMLSNKLIVDRSFASRAESISSSFLLTLHRLHSKPQLQRDWRWRTDLQNLRQCVEVFLIVNNAQAMPVK